MFVLVGSYLSRFCRGVVSNQATGIKAPASSTKVDNHHPTFAETCKVEWHFFSIDVTAQPLNIDIVKYDIQFQKNYCFWEKLVGFNLAFVEA